MRRRNLMSPRSVHLYNLGDECVDITGGWVRAGCNFDLQNTTLFSKESDHLLLDEMNARGCISVVTNSKIDLSSYKKIVIDCVAESLTQKGAIQLFIGTKVVNGGAGSDNTVCFGDYRALAYVSNKTVSGKMECDISDLTEGYIVFQCSNWANTAPQRLRVYSVELVR